MDCLPSSALVGPWAVHPAALPVTLPSAPEADPALIDVTAPDAAAAGGGSRSGVAVLQARGIVLPRCSVWLERSGWAVSAEALAGRVEAASRDGAAAVVILVDSPGGSVPGVEEAAARIAAVADSGAQVIAVADHLMVSAAYWLASGASLVVASPSAMVGSVGVISVRVSIARQLDAEGVDVDVMSRGAGKTDWMIATELSPEGRERIQAGVDATYARFVAAVARGRRLPAGRVRGEWGAQLLDAAASVDAGMADAVMEAREVVARAGSARGRAGLRRRRRMSAERREWFERLVPAA